MNTSIHNLDSFYRASLLARKFTNPLPLISGQVLAINYLMTSGRLWRLAALIQG